MSAISTENLSKVYQENPEKPVLDGINLSIAEQEFLTLLGPSGCGKSTLLHILAGLLEPSSGTARCQGEKIQGPAQSRVLMLQEAALFPWLTVKSNVTFGLKERGVPRAEREKLALAELKKVGLADTADSYPHQLSGGMQQRVALARALVLRPDIILMDEPFASLDEQTRYQLQQELVELWQDLKMTVVFVTHSIREALLISERILVMTSNPGRIKSEYRIKASYPRKPGQADIVRREEQILADLSPPRQQSSRNNSKSYQEVAAG